MDPDQAVHIGAVWPGTTLFVGEAVKIKFSRRQKQTQASFFKGQHIPIRRPFSI